MQKRQLIFVITFFGIILTSIGQTSVSINKDSLLMIWNDQSKPDSIRLGAIQEIAYQNFRYKNPDSSFYYAQLQYDFAESIDNKKAMILALNTQGDSYLIKGDPDKAYDILIRGLNISEEIDDKELKLKTLGNITRVFQTKGEIDKALEYSFQLLKISEELEGKEGVGKSLVSIGELYVGKGDLVLGLEYLNRSKKIFEEIESFYSLSRVRSIIAGVYLNQGYKEKALEVVLENATYFEKTGNESLIAGSLSNLGSIYSDLGENKKALENFEKALQLFEKTGNKPYVARLFQNIGRIYQLEGDLERSSEYFTKSLILSEEFKDKRAVASAKMALGIIMSAQGNHDKAISYGKDALALTQEMKNPNGIKNASGNLVISYKATGRYKEALEMNELYFQMRDSLESEENQKAIIQMQVKSDYEKQKALDDLENEKEVAIETQKARTLKLVSISIGIGLLLISFLAFVIYNRLKVTRQQKAIIEEQKKKVEQSEKYKEQFLANMSHEIRTPMHAISGMVKILDRNPHPPAQNVYLKAIRTSSENLVVILNDVLDLSKIEAGKLDIESIPMSPLAVMENVVQILKYKAEEKGLTLTYQVADDVPSLVMGDPTRLNQILINLAGNAIKFTEKGKVEISLNVENEKLRFSIKDTGIGISKDKQDSIFGAFEQANAFTSRYYGGTGLGLSISKQLVQLQLGKIWVESEEGRGSTFYAELPFVIALDNAVGQDLISEENLKIMSDSLNGIRILLAEDNPFNQMIAQDDLSYYLKDVKIETVENGTLAVEKFKTANYDLILMDVQMPGMNGFDAAKKIREFEKQEGRTIATPIIAMTASLLKTEIDSCYDAGMDNYIPKPYTMIELIGPIFKELRG